ncbi:NUDIX domain-containing protein [Dictyobacter formicarum]|uniref:Nudix hydrolase domain-containing protein n=1 Tax=Dictyobacter formicarum TaxID=2778368 RepID=A0ABQ3VIT7_9CHLR|nr:NUDIX hydrolase [Dictyobacter formicarum]GHO85391.1 hypothetical protein KSZ_33970 [Dictyobacter formicarum]
MFEFEILARGLYQPEDLHISYQPDQFLQFTPELQEWMEQFWQEKLRQAQQQQSLLFDAPLYRFIAARQDTAQTLQLTLGQTSYKEYVATRSQDFAAGRARSELGNPLSVCSVVETADGHILLDKRQGVDLYVGRYHVIGGFFERDIDIDATRQPDPFAAMRREIREETGIQASDISDQLCLGLVYDLATPHAELCFLTRLHISLDEVRQRKPEDSEIKTLHTVYNSPESLAQFIRQQHGNISATGEPNLLLYGQIQYGNAWFASITSSISNLPSRN